MVLWFYGSKFQGSKFLRFYGSEVLWFYGSKVQFPLLFNGAGMKLICPLCARIGLQQNIIDTVQWTNGKNPRLQPRLIHDVACPILLVSKLYRCENGHREIAACDPDLVKQIPATFVNFVTSHRSGVTKSLLQLCEQLIDKGLSLTSTEDLNQQRYNTFYNEMRKRMVVDRRIAQLLGCPANSGETERDLPGLNWSLAGTKLITSAIISNFQRDEGKYRKLFSSLSAEWISFDHTYKSVTNIGYHRSSDGKCATKLEEVFPGVPVKLDIFHAVQRFTSSIPKRKQYHAQLARDYSLVFRDPTDLGEKRTADTPVKEVIFGKV